MLLSLTGAPVWTPEKCQERIARLKPEDDVRFWLDMAQWMAKQELDSPSHKAWAEACWEQLATVWEENRCPL